MGKTETKSMAPMMIEFSGDIWNEIMSYFHSIYRRPIHLEYIMKHGEFRRSRHINKMWEGTKLIRYCSVFESYYISIIRNSWVYLTNPDLGIIPGTGQFKFRRRSSRCPGVTRDFKQIYAEYSSRNSVEGLLGGDNILSHIYY
jgi:hypothetical protein